MENFIVAIVLIQSLVFGIFCSFIANEKNRGRYSWFFLGFFFSIIAMLALIAVPKRSDIEKPEPVNLGPALIAILVIVSLVFAIHFAKTKREEAQRVAQQAEDKRRAEQAQEAETLRLAQEAQAARELSETLLKRRKISIEGIIKASSKGTVPIRYYLSGANQDIVWADVSLPTDSDAYFSSFAEAMLNAIDQDTVEKMKSIGFTSVVVSNGKRRITKEF